VEHFVPLEIWAVMVAAPCIISWFLGEMHGAARTRKMIMADEAYAVPKAVASSPRVGNSTSLVVRSTALIETVTLKDRDVVVAALEERAKTKTVRNPREPDNRAVPARRLAPRKEVQVRRRREAFDGMPSVAELRSQALLIREGDSVWDDPELSENLRMTDPISTRVLQHYVGSINELAR